MTAIYVFIGISYCLVLIEFYRDLKKYRKSKDKRQLVDGLIVLGLSPVVLAVALLLWLVVAPIYLVTSTAPLKTKLVKITNVWFHSSRRNKSGHFELTAYFKA